MFCKFFKISSLSDEFLEFKLSDKVDDRMEGVNADDCMEVVKDNDHKDSESVIVEEAAT